MNRLANQALASHAPSAGCDEVPHRAAPCSARELFCGLYAGPERHAELIEPAFHFVTRALRAADSHAPAVRDAARLGDELVSWARDTLRQPATECAAPSWPARVVREFAPSGLCDGAWLVGLARGPLESVALRQNLLEQTMLRLYGSGSLEGHAQRYANLTRSLGTAPESITRWEWTESVPCCDVSYEHALLGVSLGLFPGAFGAETLGFNLWMATLGPAPLLDRLREPLRQRAAWLRYLEPRERELLKSLASRAVSEALAAPANLYSEAAISRGFVAAHHSYMRWEQAMWSGNVPFTPADAVLDMVKRKARFAAEHHGAVKVRGHNFRDLLEAGGPAHQLLVDVLAASRWIRPGDPDNSPLMSHSLSIGGAMFDAFTASEKEDLSAWITRLAATPVEPAEPRVRVELSGHYSAPHDAEALRVASAMHDERPAREESFQPRHVIDADPLEICQAARMAEKLLLEFDRALNHDLSAQAQEAPPYSERALRELVAEPRLPLSTRHAGAVGHGGEPAGGEGDALWLRGFVQVRNAEREEWVYLARTYAAMQAAEGARAKWQLTKPLTSFARAASLHTADYLPELLGLNLSMQARVTHRELWIEWAVLAVQALMKRVRDATPDTTEAIWRRIWRMWRYVELERAPSRR